MADHLATRKHPIVSPQEWQAVRDELLAEEKEHTRRSDELARKRRELPWLPVEKEYRLDTDEGERTLTELFDGRSQLLIYHFMFGPSYEAGCPVNSSMVDGFDGLVPHLHARDLTEALEGLPPIAHQNAAACGTDVLSYICESPMVSAFALEDGVVYHTYSAYERGLDALWGMYPWLDRAPKGRNEPAAWWWRRDEY